MFKRLTNLIHKDSRPTNTSLMIEMLMSLALAFGISFYALPAIIYVANEKRLFDLPDDRKVHHNPVPALGGLAIYAGFITAFLLTVTFVGNNYVFQYLVAASLIIFFVGLKDDLLNISPFKKFLGQILAAAILVFKGGLIIRSMDGILGLGELPPVAAEAISMVTFVVIINAFNLIDGIDGLAGSLAMVSFAFFAVWFAINADYAFACLATSMCGSIAAFLIFNYPPARIFMGDTGSLIIGLINAVLVVRFIQTGSQATAWPIAAAPAIGFAVLFIPLFDTLRVFSFRILHGVSPFTPDRNHIHHILMRFGWSHLRITLSLAAASMLITGLALGMQSLGNNIVLGILLVAGFAMVGGAIALINRRRRNMLRSNLPRLVGGKSTTPVVSVSPKKAAN